MFSHAARHPHDSVQNSCRKIKNKKNHSLLSMLILGCKNYFVKPSLWPLHPFDFLSYSCVILQILDIFFEPYVVLDKSGSYSPEI